MDISKLSFQVHHTCHCKLIVKSQNLNCNRTIGFLDEFVTLVSVLFSSDIRLMLKNRICLNCNCHLHVDIKTKFKKEICSSLNPKNPEHFYDENVVHKMLIIIPKSCKCPNKFNCKTKTLLVEETDMKVKITQTRAGMKDRDYSVSIYKLSVLENETKVTKID